MSRQQSYQNRNKGFFGKVINRFKGLFKKEKKQVAPTKQNESKPSPKRIKRWKRKVAIFGCKAKSTPGFLKQAANAKKLHGHLWNGSVEVIV